MRKIISILVFGIFFYAEAFAQTLVAKTSRTDLPEGEAFLLTLDYDGSDASVPELGVLDKDFTIYSVTNSYQTNIVNGQVSQQRQWQIGLVPKGVAGTAVTVPPIKLGNVQSNPVQLRILDAQNLAHPDNSDNPGYQAPQRGPRFAVKGDVDDKNPYVQQQINYTLTLYDAGGLQGGEPEFIDDGSNSWLIRSLGEPEINSKVVNGRSLREIKFRYAMFPQKSGRLKTPVIRFNGYYLTQGGRGSDPFEEIFGGSLFDAGVGFGSMFATRNPVVLKTKPIEVNVRPIPPANNGNWWLPAESVKLYAEWSPQRPVFKVGEAVSRTVYLKAVGVVENQLPDIKFRDVAGLKQYPEKPVAQNAVENGQVVAVKKTANVYIPDKAGNIAVPEISVDWFNVRTGRMERAVLPAANIQVQPGNVSVAAQPQTMEPDMNRRGEILADSAEEAVETVAAELPVSPENRFSAYYAAIAAFILGLAVSWLLFRSPARERAKPAEKPGLRDSRRAVVRCAKESDFRGLRDALLNWAAEKFKNRRITNMSDIVRAVNVEDFEKQIDILTAELYGKGSDTWNSAAFIKAFEKADALKPKDKAADKPLPGLYKN